MTDPSSAVTVCPQRCRRSRRARVGHPSGQPLSDADRYAVVTALAAAVAVLPQVLTHTRPDTPDTPDSRGAAREALSRGDHHRARPRPPARRRRPAPGLPHSHGSNRPRHCSRIASASVTCPPMPAPALVDAHARELVTDDIHTPHAFPGRVCRCHDKQGACARRRDADQGRAEQRGGQKRTLPTRRFETVRGAGGWAAAGLWLVRRVGDGSSQGGGCRNSARPRVGIGPGNKPAPPPPDGPRSRSSTGLSRRSRRSPWSSTTPRRSPSRRGRPVSRSSMRSSRT